MRHSHLSSISFLHTQVGDRLESLTTAMNVVFQQNLDFLDDDADDTDDTDNNSTWETTNASIKQEACKKDRH